MGKWPTTCGAYARLVRVDVEGAEEVAVRSPEAGGGRRKAIGSRWRISESSSWGVLPSLTVARMATRRLLFQRFKTKPP